MMRLFRGGAQTRSHRSRRKPSSPWHPIGEGMILRELIWPIAGDGLYSWHGD